MKLLGASAEGWTSLLPFEIEFEEGVYAVTGDNGAGKSTLLALLGPIPLLLEEPSKKPSKLPKFCVPGSTADLAFEIGDRILQASIKVNASGITPLMYEFVDGDWEKLEAATGKIKPYEEIVAGLIGPKESYYASVYGGDEGGFDKLDGPERRKLFSYYLGLEPLAEKYKKINKLASELPSKDEVDKIKASIAEGIASKPELKKRWDAAINVSLAAAVIVNDFSVIVDNAKDTLRSLDGVIENKKKLAKLSEEIDDIEDELVDLRKNKARLQEEIKEPVEDQSSLYTLAEADSKIEETEHWIQGLEDKERARDKTVALIASLNERISSRTDTAISSAPCWADTSIDTMSCPFVQSAAKSEKIRKRLEAELSIAKLDLQKQPSSAAEIAECKAFLMETKQIRKRIEIAERKATLQSLAAARISDVDKSIASYTSKLLKLESDREVLRDGLASDKKIDEAERNVATAVAQLRDAQRAARDAVAAEAAAQTTFELLGQSIKKLEKELAKLEEKLEDADAIEALQRACGPAGIPIYSIAAAGPDVSEKLNLLLSSCFDDRFEAFIRTERKKNDGGYTDVFDLIVFDSDRGEDVEFGVLAKGERAIIIEALRIALAIFQAERLDIPLRVLYRDEPASNLSPENNLRYVRMLRKAKEIGNFVQVFFATHDAKAAKLADYNISIANGKITVEAQ